MQAQCLFRREHAPGVGKLRPTRRDATAVTSAILEDRDDRVLIRGATTGLHDSVPDACWVVERGFLCAEVGAEHRGWRKEGGVGKGVRDEQGLRIVAHSILNQVRETDEGESVRCVRRREGNDVPEEGAEISPVVCECVAGIWIRERCGDGGVADGREEGEAQLVARREEDRVDVREGSSVFEHRCVGSEALDGTNALYTRDVRKGKVTGWGITPYRDICLMASKKRGRLSAFG